MDEHQDKLVMVLSDPEVFKFVQHTTPLSSLHDFYILTILKLLIIEVNNQTVS